ncbi:MAG: sulfatase-like hydrolase/transferase [Myxococcales bacterium]|nr:MAG: sulfatase-like hydrolase/transferase [Myxococcales bacterium]
MRSRLALVFVVCLSGFTCDQEMESPPSAHAKLAEPEAAEPAAPEPVEAEPTPPLARTPEGTAIYQDLMALLHLADVYDPAGLLIDFGTASRLKYTIGNWNSGWLGESREGGASVSTFGKTARLYLPVESRRPMQLRFRAKPYATGAIIAYVNGKTVGEARVSKADGFREIVIPIAVDALRVGENSVMLRATRTAPVRGKSRSLAMDWLVLEPKPEEGQELAAPTGVAVQEIDAGARRRAVVLQPGERLDWFIEVPEGGSLAFGAAATSASSTLAVELQSDASALFERLKVKSGWADRQISLDRLAGEIARVRFFNEGEADIALSDARVLRRAGEVVEMKEPARNVVVLLIDTLRASKLQTYYPKTRVKTPAIDEFAAQGALFERAQSPENWTKPAVASVLTSLHPATHKTKQDASRLPRSALMLSEVYKKEGFKTASFIANGYVSNAFGFDQGWDHYTNYIRERRNTNASNVFGEAQTWIEKNKDSRFFVYIQTIDPHVPYDPPDSFLKMYDPEPYSGQVRNRRTHLMLDEAKKNPKKYKFTKRDKERI